MGHYRSEMGFEEQDRKDAEVRERRKQFLVSYIRLDIERRDVGSVLADIVEDPEHYRSNVYREFQQREFEKSQKKKG